MTILHSIAILTYARDDVLQDQLRQLADMLAGRSDYEIILIDNNADAGGRDAWLAPFAAWQYLHDGVNKGVSARNLGIHAARGDNIILLDDDVFVQTPDFLDRFARLFGENARLGAITICKTVRGETKRRVDLIPHTRKSVDLTAPFKTFRFVGGCVAFRAATLRAVGGFLPDFFYGLEEIELSYRIIDGGWEILYSPEVHAEELEHPAGRRPKKDVQTDRLANKYIISYLRMPSPYVWINLVLFTPYLMFFSGGDVSVWAACRKFAQWLKRKDRLPRKPISPQAVAYIKQCGGTVWR